MRIVWDSIHIVEPAECLFVFEVSLSEKKDNMLTILTTMGTIVKVPLDKKSISEVAPDFAGGTPAENTAYAIATGYFTKTSMKKEFEATYIRMISPAEYQILSHLYNMTESFSK